MEKTPSRYPAIGIGGSIRSRMVHGDDPALAKSLGLTVALRSWLFQPKEVAGTAEAEDLAPSVRKAS